MLARFASLTSLASDVDWPFTKLSFATRNAFIKTLFKVTLLKIHDFNSSLGVCMMNIQLVFAIMFTLGNAGSSLYSRNLQIMWAVMFSLKSISQWNETGCKKSWLLTQKWSTELVNLFPIKVNVLTEFKVKEVTFHSLFRVQNCFELRVDLIPIRLGLGDYELYRRIMNYEPLNNQLLFAVVIATWNLAVTD